MHILNHEMIILYKKILMAFIKPSIVTTICSSTLDDLKLCIENQTTTFLAKEEMNIGLITESETYIKERIEAGDITSTEVKVIRETCTSFWVEAAIKGRKRLPLDNWPIQCLGWLFPSSQSTYSEVIELAKFFSKYSASTATSTTQTRVY